MQRLRMVGPQPQEMSEAAESFREIALVNALNFICNRQRGGVGLREKGGGGGGLDLRSFDVAHVERHEVIAGGEGRRPEEM